MGKLTIELGLSQDTTTKAKSVFSVTDIKGRYWWMMRHLLNTGNIHENIIIMSILLLYYQKLVLEVYSNNELKEIFGKYLTVKLNIDDCRNQSPRCISRKPTSWYSQQ